MASFDIEREAAVFFSDDDGLAILYGNGVKSEHFFDENIREMFEWSCDYMRDHGMMKEAPSVSVLTDKFPNYPSVIDGTQRLKASYIADEMKKKFSQRMTEDVMKGAIMLLPSDPSAAVGALLDGSAAILAMNMRRTESIVYGVDGELQEKWYEERHSADYDSLGARFPVREMHEWTGGIRKGELFTLVADTGIGKTWFSCAMAVSAAKAGWNVYFAELEMGVPEITERIDIIVTARVSADQYDRGEMLPADRKAVRDARKSAAEFPGKIVVEAPPRHERTVQALIARARMHDADLVIIDQLQFIRRSVSLDSRTEQIEDIVGELKETVSACSENLKLAVLLPVQFNREKKRQGSSDQLGDTHYIGLSAAIEQVSDGILSIGQSQEMVHNNQMNAGFIKFRRGPKRKWQLKWNLNGKGFELETIQVLPDDPAQTQPTNRGEAQ